jgi:hypothetical protein
MMRTELLSKTQDEIAKVIAHLPVQKKLQIRAPPHPSQYEASASALAIIGTCTLSFLTINHQDDRDQPTVDYVCSVREAQAWCLWSFNKI